MARDMKDSGIEWIGKIPKNWTTSKLGYLCDEMIVPMRDKPHVFNGDIPWCRIEDIEGDYLNGTQSGQFVSLETVKSMNLKIYPIGTVISSCSATIGKTAITTVPCCTNQTFIGLVSGPKYYNRFLFYIMYSVTDELKNTGTGTTITYISQEKYKKINVPIPSIEEQHIIASFLDSKCAEIDKAIGATKASIEEYKKLKQAIITEAVTKGLVPNVDMKDSGIDWLGKVPISWKVVKLKNCVSIERGGSPRPIDAYLTDEIDGLNWIKIGDTEKGKRYISSVKQKIKKEGLSKTRQVHAGDLLLTNSMSFGEPYILQVDGCIHDGWLVFSNVKDIDKVFLYYFLVSKSCMDQFIMSADGGVVQNLNIEKVRLAIIVIPSIEEQKDIVYHLDTKCSEIDSLIKSKEKLIEELTAYRKSLIYEYVTGKKEVPAE